MIRFVTVFWCHQPSGSRTCDVPYKHCCQSSRRCFLTYLNHGSWLRLNMVFCLPDIFLCMFTFSVLWYVTQSRQPFWHDDVIKWKHFPRNWPFVRGIHRSPVNSPHKGQWRGALMFSLICIWINDWVNNREAGDLRHYYAHYDVIVMNYGVWP